MNRVISDVMEKLKAKGYKLTSRREHILRILLVNRDKHLSAEELYHLAKQKYPDLGLATVYKTLDLYLLIDIVCGMDFGDGRKRYQFCGWDTAGRRHDHLICNLCGKIIEVHEGFPETVGRKIYREYKFRVENHQLKVFGICGECSSIH